MSRIFESGAYLGGGPGMEFAINPTEELFGEVNKMARLKYREPGDESLQVTRERPFRGGDY